MFLQLVNGDIKPQTQCLLLFLIYAAYVNVEGVLLQTSIRGEERRNLVGYWVGGG